VVSVSGEKTAAKGKKMFSARPFVDSPHFRDKKLVERIKMAYNWLGYYNSVD
jgi:hypothetical protein